MGNNLSKDVEEARSEQESLGKVGEWEFPRMHDEVFSKGSVEDRGPARAQFFLPSSDSVFAAAGGAVLSYAEVGEYRFSRMRDEVFSRCSADDRGPALGASVLLSN